MGDASPSMISHMIGSGKKRGVPFNIKWKNENINKSLPFNIKCNDEKKAIRLNLHFL